jgi:hypothetical protein
MAAGKALGRLRLWYDKQPLWLTEKLFERAGMTALGAFVIGIVCGVFWLVLVIARYAQSLNDLRDLRASF